MRLGLLILVAALATAPVQGQGCPGANEEQYLTSLYSCRDDVTPADRAVCLEQVISTLIPAEEEVTHALLARLEEMGMFAARDALQAESLAWFEHYAAAGDVVEALSEDGETGRVRRAECAILLLAERIAYLRREAAARGPEIQASLRER